MMCKTRPADHTRKPKQAPALVTILLLPKYVCKFLISLRDDENRDILVVCPQVIEFPDLRLRASSFGNRTNSVMVVPPKRIKMVCVPMIPKG